jgi:hypothetical protein
MMFLLQVAAEAQRHEACLKRRDGTEMPFGIGRDARRALSVAIEG